MADEIKNQMCMVMGMKDGSWCFILVNTGQMVVVDW